MIDKKEVRHIAKLSRLSLTEEEQETAGRDLGKIVDYMDLLNGLDTTGVEPTFADALDARLLRSDVAQASMPNEMLLSNAPDSEDGAYRVPNVVEE